MEVDGKVAVEGWGAGRVSDDCGVICFGRFFFRQ